MDKLVSGQTIDSIRILHRQMCDGKDQLTRTIQQNVHRNYSEFVRISQEIQLFDKEMSLVRDLLLEMRPSGDDDNPENGMEVSEMAEQIDGLAVTHI
jgi:hypothetical protein